MGEIAYNHTVRLVDYAGRLVGTFTMNRALPIWISRHNTSYGLDWACGESGTVERIVTYREEVK